MSALDDAKAALDLARVKLTEAKYAGEHQAILMATARRDQCAIALATLEPTSAPAAAPLPVATPPVATKAPVTPPAAPARPPAPIPKPMMTPELAAKLMKARAMAAKKRDSAKKRDDEKLQSVVVRGVDASITKPSS